MKYTKTIVFLATAALLASCQGTQVSSTSTESSSNSSKDDYQVKWVTPTGSPTLLFYDQGNNSNWISSSTPQTTVVPAFTNNNQDAIVFDGATGLSLIKKNSYNYQLASWLTGGTFYVVSCKYTTETMVKSNITVDGFVQTGSSSLVFNRLASESWNMTFAENGVHYETGVADVKASILANPVGYDYYIVAEPVLTATKAELAKGTSGKTLNVIYNLQDEWKSKYNQSTIPAAALFINKTSYAAHKDVMDTFIADTATRATNAVDNPTVAVNAINAYSADTTVQSSRFGFTATLAGNLQKTNKFNVIKPGTISDNRAFVNDYETSLGSALSFDTSLFLQ